MNQKINVDVKSIERSLLDEEFPNEAAQLIDLNILSEYDRKLLNKCLKHEHFDEDEFNGEDIPSMEPYDEKKERIKELKKKAIEVQSLMEKEKQC